MQKKDIIEKWANDISRLLTRSHIKMALKHMKRFSTSLVSGKMLIKITLRSTRYMLMIKKTAQP